MKTLSSVPPRLTHPYGGYHMDGYSVFARNVFAFFASLLCVPNIFGSLNRKLVAFTKFVHGVFCVSLTRHVLKIFRAIVVFVTIFVVYVPSWRAMTYERRRYHRVDSFVDMFVCYRKSDKQVPISSARGHQNFTFGRFVRYTSKYFADHRLAYPDQRRNFSGAAAFLAHLMYKFNLFVRQFSLRNIAWPDTSNSPFRTYLVLVFKTVHGFPKFHVNTPSS